MIHHCAVCGYGWEHGKDGSHHCGAHLRNTCRALIAHWVGVAVKWRADTSDPYSDFRADGVQYCIDQLVEGIDPK